MTLFELCDKLGATLVIKRMSLRCNKIKYTVNIKRARVYENSMYSSFDSYQTAMIIGEDVNQALYDLCDKISYKFIKCGYREIETGRVVKDKLSILGVW